MARWDGGRGTGRGGRGRGEGGGRLSRQVVVVPGNNNGRWC